MSANPPILLEDVAYGFCPGCSHSQVTDALGAALQRLAGQPNQQVLVSDIGCVGLVDKHFGINTFHGLHGRSVTYGVGLKLARPELQVVVVIGDGGCGIGGHHLIQAARRDVDITVVVYNNFNYGMTGGEHSATTPVGAFTSSTPGGNLETPLDLCALAMASGASFAARAAAFDDDLPDVIERAVQHPGFALIDVWELCTAYFMPRNDFKKRELLALSERADMPFGVLRQAARPTRQSAAREAPARIDLTPVFPLRLDRRVQLIIAGSAGQKVKSAATTLGRAAIRSHAFVTQKDDYPITVKTGHSVSELIVSPDPIHHTAIDTPDVLIALTQDGVRRVGGLFASLSSATHVYADDNLDLPPTDARVTRVPFTAAGKKVGRENAALWALAYVAWREGLIAADALVDTVTQTSPARYREQLRRAVEAAIDQATPLTPTQPPSSQPRGPIPR